jgi:hypothetical protein
MRDCWYRGAEVRKWQLPQVGGGSSTSTSSSALPSRAAPASAPASKNPSAGEHLHTHVLLPVTPSAHASNHTNAERRAMCSHRRGRQRVAAVAAVAHLRVAVVAPLESRRTTVCMHVLIIYINLLPNQQACFNEAS